MNDSTDVTSRIGNAAPGTKIAVEVWRDGKPVTINATVGTFDEEKVAKADDGKQDKGRLGLALRPLTPDEKKEVGHDGLVVENATGPAAKAGIQPGDLVVGVGTTKVTTLDELKKHVDKAGQEHRASDRARRAADLRAGSIVLGYARAGLGTPKPDRRRQHREATRPREIPAAVLSCSLEWARF